MSRVASPPSKAIFLHNVDWETYVGLSSLFDERPGTRLTYDCGRLEIMAALTFEHENDSHFLGRVVEVLTEELELPIRPGKSTTLRRQLVKRGLEPDECFWIANSSRIQGRRRIDLNRDPPPDLAIEVVVAHGVIDRLGLYTALGVPEVWWLKKNVLRFNVVVRDFRVWVRKHRRPS